ncbi:MAG: MFS transporter [Candidatus Pacebacteria bacterium]|jgi:MFS transporter, DHA1 family, tetracycline resistance protein|nr:MFS transporter [Candidatus Paceibacterota bacterium]MBT3511563.1 MFS transporter [Candidatus Paceibacterota bacterium]MBT4004967.1 MFS transporter [Candidatus Paceibacterota bacterium]MBT4358743.1 MFS transporter [Candidatus Paceibacterota bacterium]MBT4680922.1 MFS transporter [Candidatus Paceibacterota bacterium]
MKWRREHTIIFMIKITEVLGFSLILPFLPFYAQNLGASPTQVGLVLATFSLFQFISAPIMGKLSDSYGRIPLLLLSQLSTLISFIVLGFANSLWMLFLSRMIDGLLGSNYTIAQAYLSDITPKNERTKIFSLTGIAFSIGFFIGPALGGYLAQFSYALPSFLAAGMAAITIITTYLYLPETVDKSKNFTWSWKILKLKQFKLLMAKPKISLPLWEFFSYVLTHGLWASSFALYAERQFNFGSQDIGYIFAIIGAVTIFIKILILPKLLNIMDEDKLRIIGAATIILALGATPWMQTRAAITTATIIFAFGASLLRPSLTSHVSNQAPKDELGEFMGVSDSLGSISQIIGPLLGGFLIQNFFPGSLGLVAAATMTVGLILMIMDRKISQD